MKKIENNISFLLLFKNKFLDRIENINKDCWVWKGTLLRGYGVLNLFNKKYAINTSIRAHRYSYILYKGQIPKDLIIRHLCHNKKCVNPNHLKAGTYLDNAEDSSKAGHYIKGEIHHRAKLTENKVKIIANSSLSNRELAKKYGVTHSAIGSIKRGKIWKHLKMERKINNKPEGTTKEEQKFIKKDNRSIRKIAEDYKISASTIWRIKNNKNTIVK